MEEARHWANKALELAVKVGDKFSEYMDKMKPPSVDRLDVSDTELDATLAGG